MHLSRSSRAAGLTTLLAAGLFVLGLLVPASAGAAGSPPSMAARALLQGHVRTGSWFAVAVDVENAGPTVTGELRISGGADSRTRFGTPVELATGSRKTYLLYAQPPSFGGNMKVQLVSGSTVVAETKVAIAVHDPQQTVVGVISENPARLVGELRLLPGANGVSPAVVALSPADLPEQVQAWSGMDRLVWQDVDTSLLTPGQLSALRTWIAGGGRLVLIGGTAGADVFAALPDDLLPYRPTSVLDIDPSSLRPVLGGVPDGAATLTAYAGNAGAGRPMAESGDRVIAADRRVGNGVVTLLGFDPTTAWIAKGDTWDTPLWRRLLPPRSTVMSSLVDDSQIVSAVANLPSLNLPPIGGLLVLIFGYIVLVGPVNYAVLRKLDRREWAWATVPALILVFTVGSFGIGAAMRGNDIVVNEITIVRGAPGTDAATAQSYLGVFSPSRSTLQVRIPGGALLSAPINGDIFGNGQVNTLDILQGDPARVRDLAVGVGSLRTIRADTGTTGPTIDGDLQLVDGVLTGTVTNRSADPVEEAAVVVGASAQRLGTLAPGASAKVALTVGASGFNQSSLSDRVLGPMNWSGSQLDEAGTRMMVRRSVIDQVAMDPSTGMNNALPSDNALLIAWGTGGVVPVEIEGQKVRRASNVLYEIPMTYGISGRITFRNDLIRSATLDVGGNFFSKDPWALNLGPGSARVAYRPIAFNGTLTPVTVRIAMTFGGDATMPGGAADALRETTRCEIGTAGCVPIMDGFPELEVLDVRAGQWIQFEHLSQGHAYELADAARWVDPTTGEVQVRFVNQRQDQVSFQFAIEITGTVR